MFNKLYDKIKEFIKTNWSFLLIITVLITIFCVKVPYEVEMPGGTIDLGNRITVDGKKTPITGSFNMAYVGVVQGKIPYVLLGLVLPDWEVIKESDILYENETIEESNVRDKLYLEQSKNMATIAALKAADIDYEIKSRTNNVVFIDKKAKTSLKIGDNIVECEGKPVSDINTIIEIIKTKKIGDQINLKVIRNNQEKQVKATIYNTNEGPKIGVMSMTTLDIKSAKEIKINSKESESGPSGGLMMSLMIYNALTKQDLTHGRKIVGTGTISEDGTVGEIGGVKYKIMGAAYDDADVFFVPEKNYKEAIKTKKEKNYDIKIVKVKTLQDAINYLERNKKI